MLGGGVRVGRGVFARWRGAAPGRCHRCAARISARDRIYGGLWLFLHIRIMLAQRITILKRESVSESRLLTPIAEVEVLGQLVPACSVYSGQQIFALAYQLLPSFRTCVEGVTVVHPKHFQAEQQQIRSKFIQSVSIRTLQFRVCCTRQRLPAQRSQKGIPCPRS